ncbi:MAG TPA: DUF4377 domain-containing protein [Fluviicola sp.]|nr:DUF4377 domain-containing protein [Fluviicola sp.]
MKALLTLALLLLGTAVYAGSPDTNPNFSGSEVIKMRIQSSQVDCDGVSGGPMCYSVQKESKIGKDNWEILEQSIEGFEYEPGYVYDVTVKIERVENASTNQVEFRYTLIDVIAKQAD